VALRCPAEATPLRPCYENRRRCGTDQADQVEHPQRVHRFFQDEVENGYVTLPDLRGIGFEGKADLINEMRALAH
jgi:L-alanine-DL-glutamate epimerase-like enolase superfamily enzyme